MSSSPINEVPIQINSYPPVATFGEASKVSSWATTCIEHCRRGLKKRLEGYERDSYRRRSEGCKGIRVLRVDGDAFCHDIARRLALSLSLVHWVAM